MPVELVIDIDIKENYNSLLKEKVIIQDATKVSFICKECNKKIIVKSFYNWRKRSGVFIELQKAHADEINSAFFQKAKFEYEAYCDQCKALAARRYHRRTTGSYQYKTY